MTVLTGDVRGRFVELDEFVNVSANRRAGELAVCRANLHWDAVRRKQHRRFDVRADVAARYDGESKTRKDLRERDTNYSGRERPTDA